MTKSTDQNEQATLDAYQRAQRILIGGLAGMGLGVGLMTGALIVVMGFFTPFGAGILGALLLGAALGLGGALVLGGLGFVLNKIIELMPSAEPLIADTIEVNSAPKVDSSQTMSAGLGADNAHSGKPAPSSPSEPIHLNSPVASGSKEPAPDAKEEPIPTAKM